MSSPVASLHPAAKPGSAKRHLERRILTFSLSLGAVATVVAGLVYLSTLLPSIRDARNANIVALTEIACTDDACDAGNYTSDAYSEKPDYVIDTKTGYFFDFRETPDSPATFQWLDFGKSEFVDTGQERSSSGTNGCRCSFPTPNQFHHRH